jgi:phosphoglycolate phosphatase
LARAALLRLAAGINDFAMAAPTIVFDLDGTLIDTAPDLVDTLNLIFAREGLPPVPYETARNLIGGGARMMIARGLEAEGRALSPAEAERLFTDFIAHYSEHIADRSRPFPGLVDALDTMAAGGSRFVVCTNKLERLSVKLLKQLDLAHRFAVICGQDTFGVQKPDPEVLRRTVAAAGGTLRNAIMVGDSLTDIRTARAAGIPVVAVDFGYTDRPVTELGPDRVISRFAQLPAIVAELCGAN